MSCQCSLKSKNVSSGNNVQGLPVQASHFTEGETETQRRVGSSKSDIQAGRVYHQWTPKFQFCTSSDQTYEMTYQSLICEVAIIKPIV